jgi:hypothetical protein
LDGGNYSNNKNELKSLKNTTLSPLTGWIRKWSNSLSYWITLIKPLGVFYMYSMQVLMLQMSNNYTSQLMVMTQDALVIADKVCGFHSANFYLGDFRSEQQTLTSQLTDGTSGKVYNGKSPKICLVKI